MVAVRAWHPVRLALVCAVLAMAGGSAGARGTYAEVASATAAAAVHAGRHALAVRASSTQPAVAPALVAVRLARPATVPLVAAPLYLAHCALLL
jgi:hypothetical protein